MRKIVVLGFAASALGFALTQGCGGGDGGSNFIPGPIGEEAGSSSGVFGTSGGIADDSGGGGEGDGGQKDAPVAVCGNGIQEGAETCDDGDKTKDDGCSDACALEANYVCNIPGQKCAKIGGCGDGMIQPGEECDDKNTGSSDGCSDTCKIETGWICPIVAAACFAKECGDGILAGTEECDDGDKTDGNGCSKTCLLQDGFKCETPGQKCVATTCGDNKVEGTEQCDLGDTMPYDGCSPTCTKEPVCPKAGGACTGSCGDGAIFPGEECDDGNSKDGDGCSRDCKEEDGFTCSAVTAGLPNTLNVPIIYRDFSRGDGLGVCATSGACPNAHPDMDPYSGSRKGIPGLLFNNGDPTKTGTLDAVDGKPQYRCTGTPTQCTVTSATSFSQWYRDLPGNGTTTRVNHTIATTLPLTKKNAGLPNENFVFTDTTFFPIDSLGFGNQYKAGEDGGDHNFHFTSELRFWFKYDQQAIDTPPSFLFTGDDDVFVFINGKLAVDLGGVHVAEDGGVLLNPANAALLDVKKDNVYEFALFQAERNRSLSSYTATFEGFARAKSVCLPDCGDKVKTKFEACDEGVDNDKSTTPAYGKCASDCKSRGAFCGDGTKQEPQESCDDGPFNGGYNKCKTDCSGIGPRCGDGALDKIYGEVCDDGPNNDTNVLPASAAYGKCSSDCRSKPRCGDGIVQAPEKCDGGQGCSATCTLVGAPN